MLIVCEKRDTGHVVHLIVGQETSLTLDINGTVSTTITELAKSIAPAGDFTLMMTRCESEVMTARSLASRDIPYVFSGQPSVTPSTATKPVAKTDTPEGRCSYCDKCTALAPVPNYSICPGCLQIELGRSRPFATITKPEKQA